MVNDILRADIAGNGTLLAVSCEKPLDVFGTYGSNYFSLEVETENVNYVRETLENGFELRFRGTMICKLRDAVFSEVKLSVIPKENGEFVITYTADFDLSLRLDLSDRVSAEYIGASETGKNGKTAIKLTKNESAVYIISESGGELDSECKRIAFVSGEGRLFVTQHGTEAVPSKDNFSYAAVLKKIKSQNAKARNICKKVLQLQSSEGGFFLGNETEKTTDILKILDYLFSVGCREAEHRAIGFLLSLCEKHGDIPTHSDAVYGKTVLSGSRYNPVRDELILLLCRHIGELSENELERFKSIAVRLADKNSARLKKGLLPFSDDGENGGRASFVSTVKHIGAVNALLRASNSGRLPLSPSKKRCLSELAEYMKSRVREEFTRGLTVYFGSALSKQKTEFKEGIVLESYVGAEIFPIVLTDIDIDNFDIAGLSMSLEYYRDKKENQERAYRLLLDKTEQVSSLPELCFAFAQVIKYRFEEGKYEYIRQSGTLPL